MVNLDPILDSFGIDPATHQVNGFGSGLIHATYLVRRDGEPVYILQRVNHHVFRHPEDIAHNIRVIGNFLTVHAPDYIFTVPLPNKDGFDYQVVDGHYFRVFPFVRGSHTVDVCTEPGQAWEAAAQFGKFTAVLKDLRTDMLRYTIPGFHDLTRRFHQFTTALKEGNPERLKTSSAIAEKLLALRSVVDRYEQCKASPAFRWRVTHHDTKISNILLDEKGKGICVIDLDTVMPGLFISDVGDMIRTYVSPANEEEQDLDKVVVRKEFLEAIISGYHEHMYDQLSVEERDAFIFAGEFMIYMQALRFYTDHLMNDSYYGARYEGHNLMRAANQLRLLDGLIASR